MEPKLTTKQIRDKFKEETGKNAIITSIKESEYRTGYPKKTRVETYNPVYALWLENFLIKLSE